MPASYMPTEDPQEPSQIVCPGPPVQPPGDIPASPDPVHVATLLGDQDNLSILNGHSNFFVPSSSDLDQQPMTTQSSNGTLHKEERNGEGKSDVADEFANNTQSWQVFSHTISVKTGFPDSESWSQENGHNGKVSFDTLGLEEEILSQENGHNRKVSFDTLELEDELLKFSVEGLALSQPDTSDLKTLAQENGHNAEVSFDTLELEEETLKLPVVKGRSFSQPATYDLTVVIPTRNERDNIMPLLHELQEALDGIRVEIIFVDDSDDDTPLIIKDASVAMGTSMLHVHLEH